MIKRFLSANQLKPVDFVTGQNLTPYKGKDFQHKDNVCQLIYETRCFLSQKKICNATFYIGKDVHSFLNKHPDYHYNEMLGCLRIGKDIKLICDGKTPKNMIRFNEYEIEVKNL